MKISLCQCIEILQVGKRHELSFWKSTKDLKWENHFNLVE